MFKCTHETKGKHNSLLDKQDTIQARIHVPDLFLFNVMSRSKIAAHAHTTYISTNNIMHIMPSDKSKDHGIQKMQVIFFPRGGRQFDMQQNSQDNVLYCIPSCHFTYSLPLLGKQHMIQRNKERSDSVLALPRSQVQ